MLCQECHFAGEKEDEKFIDLADHPHIVHTLRPSPGGIQLLAHYIGRCSVCKYLVLFDTNAWELRRPSRPEQEELTDDETPPEKAH